jgi:hypothetical protein
VGRLHFGITRTMGVSSGVENSVSAWASVFNLGNCAIGAGILSFPYAIQCSGVLIMCQTFPDGSATAG